MSKTFTFLDMLTTAEGSLPSQTSYTAAQVIEVDEALGTVTNQLVNVAFAIANLKAILIKCTVAATLKTNSSGSPTNTIALQAGKPYIWRLGGYVTNLITANVTALYITTTGFGTLTIQALVDPTP